MIDKSKLERLLLVQHAVENLITSSLSLDIHADFAKLCRNAEEKARVTGVAPDGGLMIEDENGPRILRTGEVTLGSGTVEGLLQT